MQKIFDLSKLSYIRLITEHTETISKHFMTLQKELTNCTNVQVRQ